MVRSAALTARRLKAIGASCPPCRVTPWSRPSSRCTTGRSPASSRSRWGFL